VSRRVKAEVSSFCESVQLLGTSLIKRESRFAYFRQDFAAWDLLLNGTA
jgi:hypothetical protein